MANELRRDSDATEKEKAAMRVKEAEKRDIDPDPADVLESVGIHYTLPDGVSILGYTFFRDKIVLATTDGVYVDEYGKPVKLEPELPEPPEVA
ncbi:hypothetical protein KAR91_23765 [Candidatus Pacearchaeota archaeon]|nr:hypothetical protein [Candidatus Pacearchaeota archaeon]